MKITTNLTHIATAVEFEPAVTEDALKAKFEEFGVQGFEAELDIAERTETMFRWFPWTPFLALPRLLVLLR